MRYIVNIKLLVKTTIFISLFVQPVLSFRVKIPRSVFYYQPAASVFGAEAAWVNPAGLARYNITSYQFMADFFDGSFSKSWGTVANRDGLGLAYRKIDNPGGENYREYLFAASMPVGKKLYFGGSYRYFKEGPDIYHKRHFWNIGLMGNNGEKLNWGAVFSNLNRGKVNGRQSDTEQRYSLSYRPSGVKYTFSVDMLLSTGMKLREADFIYHFEVIPTPGLYINGFIESNKNFQIGFRTNLLQYFVGGRHSSDKKGNHLGTSTFFGATNLRQPSLIKERPRRLTLTVSGRPDENPPRPVIGKRQTSFVTILLNIYRAAEDPYVSEMVLSLNRLSLGFGQAQELRDALEYFKSKNKTITCHISYPNNIAYYIGSICNRVLIPPVSQLILVGLRAELTFYAGTLEKLGVNVELLRIGKYKTGAETFTRKAASEENREQINRQLDDIYDQFVTGIARGRNLSVDSVKVIIDNGPYTSAEALEYGLVDGLSYRDEVNQNFLVKMPKITFRRYLTDTLLNDDWQEKPKIAVVVASGEVMFDKRTFTLFESSSDVTPAKMKKAFQQTIDATDVEGIVFRINSPGGLALAGDEIYHFAGKAAEKKPLVVSMANVAASGGYYMAMPAKHIFANPSTITGSIGIYGGKADFSKLYNKIDLGKELFTRGKYAGMFTTIRPFTMDEREKFYSQLKAMYGYFLSLVADNRNLTVDSVDNLARGRVWTGREALENGLVDELGGLKQALDFSAKRLGLDDYRVKLFPEKRPFIVLPGLSFFNTVASIFSKNDERSSSAVNPITFLKDEGIFTRLPFDIEIK